MIPQLKFLSLPFKVVFTIALCVYLVTCSATTAISNGIETYEIKLLDVAEGTLQQVQFKLPLGAVAVKIYSGDFTNAFIKVGGTIYSLFQDPDSEMNNGFYVSNLTILPASFKEMWVSFGNMKGKIEIHGYYQSFNQPKYAYRTAEVNCTEPYSIPPSIWRAGLNPPVKAPDSTIVEHIIIHHSAIDVSNSNIENAVRYIYLLHTVTNGWDDIGYNFLVAPDGTIFQGRDDWGLYNKDNVKGAHYCGKNSNTMGICLMGNFMLNQPNLAALHSLELLTAWKLQKEHLAVYGSSIHPKGGTSTLPNIAGHRDSCYTMTECPGDFLYARFSEIRQATDSLKQLCLVANTISRFKVEYVEVFPSPVTDELTLKSTENEINEFIVYNLKGEKIHSGSFNLGKASVSMLHSGIYFLKIKRGTGDIYSRFVKL